MIKWQIFVHPTKEIQYHLWVDLKFKTSLKIYSDLI